MTSARDDLSRAAAADDRAERTVRVAAVLSEELGSATDRAVLVGGGAVEVYTRSAFTTHDLDFIAATTPALEKRLADLGFERDRRHWVHVDLALAVEFPGTVLAPARSTTMHVGGRRLQIIAVEDLIVDRLASWKHWGWDPDGAAAVLLLALHQDLDDQRLSTRAEEEDVSDALAALGPLSSRTEPVTAEELKRLRAALGA